jgi:hypothetical protein
MNSQKALLAVTATLVLLAIIGIASGQTPEVLKPGEYTAKVKAITCGGCGPLIKKTMMGMKEIESVSVDSEKKTVQFVVKKDVTLKMADLQKALKAAAEVMGMGADYTLSELKAAK